MWRVLFLSAVTAMILNRDVNKAPSEDCIVKTKLYGEIFYDEDLLLNIESLKNNDKVKGVLIHVDSPGGTITGSEAIYKAMNELKATKPLVISVQDVAASGGYMAIMGANKIFAYETSAIGSIGVMMQGFVDVSELAEKIGIKFYNFKSSPLKGIPNNFEKPTDAGNKSLQGYIDELKFIFTDMVKVSRPKISNLELACNGEAFSGRKSLEYGLIDAIGTERDALKDLKENYNLKSDLPVIEFDILPQKEQSSRFFLMMKSVVKALLQSLVI